MIMSDLIMMESNKTTFSRIILTSILYFKQSIQ